MESTLLNGILLDKALRLVPGGIYVIECSHILNVEAFKDLHDRVNAEGERLGVQFLLLSKGLNIARGRQSEDFTLGAM